MANKTIPDIVKSLRDGSIYDDCGCFDSHELANDIEAAAKREAGNAARMREAIDRIKNTANSALTAPSVGNCPWSFLWEIVSKCDSALSAPPPPDKREVCEILDELFAADADGDDREFNAVLARLRNWHENKGGNK